MDPFLGEIRAFAFPFAPRGWAMCNGQTLSIKTYTALYALLGTLYGGDGKTTFALPDLRDRLPVGAGQGTGLSPYRQGQTGGTPTVTLTLAQIPAHTHALSARAASPTGVDPTGQELAEGRYFASGNKPFAYYKAGSPTTAMAANAIASAGGSQPHDNMMPFVATNWCIALLGTFPSRP